MRRSDGIVKRMPSRKNAITLCELSLLNFQVLRLTFYDCLIVFYQNVGVITSTLSKVVSIRMRETFKERSLGK